MTHLQLGLIATPHNNQQLFSDHYLNETLPEHPAWRSLREDAARVMAELTRIYERFVPSTNEAQTEREWIQPVLSALGHIFEVQAPIEAPGGTKRPDYLLYYREEDPRANRGRVLTEELLRGKAYAVADAKHWDRRLDVAVRGARELFDNRNPSYQIAFYMAHTGVPWGILTNGRLWRLYHRDTAHKLDRFYEVDLPALLESRDPARFMYFFFFFRREAFEPGYFGVADVLRESTDYARGVSEKLKLQVFEALRHIAQGFLDHPENQLEPTSETLATIYNNALILLYRLLFILYAEARELLPLRSNASYRRSYSLHEIKHQVANDLDSSAHLLPQTATLWSRLKALFHIINEGSPPLNVATFNGGLFDPERHPFLERYAVGDYHLQRAIDILARVDRQFIDYRDLAEQHLGAIYEGLLEYHLVPIPPEGGWTVDLVNERGERKRTGSYYTPNYIVKYMVELALGPVLREAIADKPDDASKIRAILDINVLDPAMGSGYFLVEATEYIARFLVDQIVAPADDGAGEPDLVYWKRRVVQSCIYGVDINPLAVELAKLSLWLSTAAKDRPLSFLDHHLRVGNSVVGARVSELQRDPGAEQARRRAARKAAKAAAAGQMPLLDDESFRRSMSLAVDSMWLIEGSAGNTVADVKEQERIYAQLRETLARRYGQLADVVTATHFGVEVPADLWQPLRDLATGRAVGVLPQLERILRRAGELAAGHRFFHWDLEFPEVFFDRYGQALGDRAGFDAVIGNPPYVRQERLVPIKPYLEGRFPDVAAGTADIYVYFFERGLEVLRQGGRLAYISSNSWLRAAYARKLRSFLKSRVTLETIIDLGDNRVFISAQDTYPAISVMRKELPAETHTAQAAVFTRGEGVQRFDQQVAEKLFPIAIHDQPDAGWQLTGTPERKLLAKLQAGRSTLGDVLSRRLYRGVLTGLNDAFIVDHKTRDRLIAEDPHSAEILRPILRGEDLRPWYQEDEGRWLIFARRGINIDEFPAIKAHLLQFRERLEPRPRDWDDRTDKWPGRKAGNYQWYELQDTIDFHEAFSKPKILWPELARRPRFSWDASGAFINNKGFIAPTDDPSLLGLLGSRVVWFIIIRTCLGLGERAGMQRYQLFEQYISQLPVPEFGAGDRERLGELAMEITQCARARYDLHRRARHRILTDLGTPGGKLNQKLSAWWELDFPHFRAEVRKSFKRDITVNERDDWEAWLAEHRAEHQRYTAEMVRLEAELNERVYALFELTPDEIRVIEETTKYEYGEV
ncbi:MAG: N-6 DNA methylase [Sphaerobacter sp.]|nr:N-6 DNA methylase [Sphaerobacter sp.]